MNDMLPIKSELKVDLTDSANSVVNNVLGESTKQLGHSGGTLLNFFNNTVLLPLQIYNLSVNFKLEEYKTNLETRLKLIPLDKQVEPKINVIGPTLEALKYNMNEEELKKMFTNLLVNSCNSDYSNRVLPAYVEIIKQISEEDAKFLYQIKYYDFSMPLIITQIKFGNSAGANEHCRIIPLSHELVLYPEKIILENLERLKIINIYEDKYIEKNDLYESCFEMIKEAFYKSNISNKLPEHTYTYKKATICFTDFGKNFIYICLS